MVFILVVLPRLFLTCFFADDSLIFAHARMKEVEQIKQVLALYERESVRNKIFISPLYFLVEV